MLVGRAQTLGWPELKVKRVVQFNERSRRLSEKLGFVVTGSGVDDDGHPYWTLAKRLR